MDIFMFRVPVPQRDNVALFFFDNTIPLIGHSATGLNDDSWKSPNISVFVGAFVYAPSTNNIYITPANINQGSSSFCTGFDSNGVINFSPREAFSSSKDVIFSVLFFFWKPVFENRVQRESRACFRSPDTTITGKIWQLLIQQMMC
jgi:hypothetical protein